MKQLNWLAFAGVAFAALIGTEGAQGSGSAEPEKSHARPRLISEHAALVPGTTAYLGVTFEIDKGWHIYWDGACDTGMPPQVTAALPGGYRAGDLLWPAPKRYTSPGDLLDYIYEDRVTLLLPVHVPADAKPGEQVTISAQLDWLECRDICLAGEADVELTLPIAAAPAAKSPDAARFDEARKRLPRPLPTDSSSLSHSWSGRRLTITAPDATALAFYPKTDSLRMINPIRDGAASGDFLAMEFEAPRSGRSRIIGVLEVSRGQDAPPDIFALDLPGPP